jgi:plasmid maintenance system antidote protein VapI
MTINVHIGSLVREKLKAKGMRIIDFAHALHYSRANIYSIFDRRSIDSELLIKISQILDYDFNSIYHEKALLIKYR